MWDWYCLSFLILELRSEFKESFLLFFFFASLNFSVDEFSNEFRRTVN